MEDRRLKIKKLHRLTGLIFAPFFIITALTGMVLLWRKAGIYEKSTKGILLGIHNWEAVTKYIGVILAAGLLCMAITWLVMALKARRVK